MLRATKPVRRIVFTLAWVVAAALLLRFAWDFTAAFWPAGGTTRLLVPPFWALVVATLAVAARNILATTTADRIGMVDGATGTLLRVSVPGAFLAASLGCSGLAAAGCSGICTAVRWVGVPLLAAAMLAPYPRRRAAAPAILGIAALTLLPHCICENPANAWWVARLGASPMCYAWAFAAALVALSAESSAARRLPSLLVNAAILAGSLGFFAAHHFGGYPW